MVGSSTDLIERQLPGVTAALSRIVARETETFAARTPGSREHHARARRSMPHGVPMSWMAGLYPHPPIVAVDGAGSRFRDIDGNQYLDFNLADYSMAAGFAHPAIVAAITDQAPRGNHFLLPVEQAAEVAELLAERFGLPYWQVTLSASGANVEALRLARVATGRTRTLLFDGKYHGHIDETLWYAGDAGMEPEALGLAPGGGRDVVEVPYNDLDAVERTLAEGDIAAILVEPALTNCTLVLPDPAFLPGLRALADRHGAVLIHDETHTQFAVYGGGTRHFGVRPDIVTGGKGIAGGVPIGVYGMSERLARVFEDHPEVGGPGLATGGTTFATALALAAARAGLAEVFTPEAMGRVNALGARLAAGLDGVFARHGVPWRAHRLGGRCGWELMPAPPRTGAEGYASVVKPLASARRLHMANRGVWDAILTSGPSVSVVHSEADIDAYVAALDAFLVDLRGEMAA